MSHWTISRLKDWETCPAKYKFSYVERVPRESHPAAARGTIAHEGLEAFLLDAAAPWPTEVDPRWTPLVKALRAVGATPEQEWGFDADWHPCGYDAPEMWLRMKIDVHYHLTPGLLRVIDYKTGKPYTANRDQMEVYALGALAQDDRLASVQTELWYLDQFDADARTFTRAQAPKLARKWEGRAGKMLADEDYRATPGRHCGWCPFKAICPDAV